jgi:hypothetical protein
VRCVQRDVDDKHAIGPACGMNIRKCTRYIKSSAIQSAFSKAMPGDSQQRAMRRNHVPAMPAHYFRQDFHYTACTLSRADFAQRTSGA